MIVKICQFRARRDQGERLVEVFHPGEMEKAAEFFSMGKTAAPLLPQVQKFLGDLRPEPSKIYVLVNALGAGEYWGSNINGDYFPEGALIHTGPIYGYETFYQAFPYKHHVNKDPTRSFGKVALSCWHNDMKRVELVVCIDRDLAARFGAQDVCDKLDHGMFPDVSMGCKVPYDLCSKCLDWDKYREAQSTFDPMRHKSVGVAVLEFHKTNPIRGLSVTRNDYCEHLKNQLNQILPDGVKIYAINDYPRFFDISFVFIGADKTAKVMAKLASAGHQNRVIPSWYLAEEMGYRQPVVEKGFEKAAAAVPPAVKRFSKELVENVVDRYHPERMSFKRAVRLTQKATGALHPEEEKSASIDSVRARLREKKASQNKGAEIIKEVVPSQFGGKALPVDHDSPDLPNDVLDALGGCPLHEALSTPTTMGMILRPREFQRIMIISIGKKDLADKMDSEGTTFPPTGEHDLPVPVGADHFSDVIKNMLLPLMEGRSGFEPIVKRRIVQITIRKSPEGGGVPEEHHEAPAESLKTAAETPFLRKIAAAYNGYLDRVADCFRGAADVVNSRSDLWEAVFRSGLADGFEKSAAGDGKISPAVLFGATAGAYALSQYAKWQRTQAMMGAREPVGAVTDFMADHPKLMMLLAGMGALHQQKSEIPTRIVQGLKGVFTSPNA